MSYPKYARYIYAMRVEGIGDMAGSGTDKRTRWSWGPSLLDDPSQSWVADHYVTGLLRWPGETEFGYDPRTGDSTFGSQSFPLRATAAALATFYAGIPNVAARLSTALTAASTTVVLDTSGLSGVVYLEREAILLGTESGAGPYTYTGCTRGVLGTTATAHGVDATDDREVFTSMHRSTLTGRLVELIRTPIGATAESDETVRWRGVIVDVATANGGGELRIEAEHTIALLATTRIYRDPWRMPSAYLGVRPEYDQDRLPDGYYAGGSGQRPFLVVDDDSERARFITADTRTVNGETVLGAIGSADTPFMGSPVSDLLASWEFPALREFLSTHASAPSNAAAASTNTLPLRQNPGELVLQLLLTTPNDGSPGPNDATYDTGVELIAGAIPAQLVDIDQIEAWGRRQPAMTSLHIGDEGPESVLLMDFLKSKVLGPLQSAFVQRQGGKIGVASFADAAVYGVANAVSQSQILSVENLTQRRNLRNAIDSVKTTYRARPGMDPDILVGTDVIKYKRQPRGTHDRLELDAGAWEERYEAAMLAQRLIARWHDSIDEWELRVQPDADWWPGDIVSVTHDKLLANGTRGVTSQLCLVVSRRERIGPDADTYLRVWHVGEVYDAIRYIAPAAEVASVAAGGAGEFTLTMVANQYTSADGPALTADANGFTVGDKAQLVTKYGVIRDAEVTVSARSGNDVTVTGCSVTPVATDVLRHAEYGTATSSQKSTWAYIADADNLLAGVDPANEYVTG
jgi:hypothetical protein